MISNDRENKPNEDVPDYYRQRQIVLPSLNEKLSEDAVWRIIPFKWLESWKDIAKRNKKNEQCPPLDVSIFFEKDGKLKNDLKEEKDYTLVPEVAYKNLDSWHGNGNGDYDTSRKVIKVGKFTVRLIVEVYRVPITIWTKFSTVDSTERNKSYILKDFTRFQSKADMIRDILVGASDLFERVGQTRNWSRETEHDKWRLINDDSQSLYELGLIERGHILCEFQNDDGSWPQDQIQEEELRSRPPVAQVDSVSIRGGKCGLVNLGNTCFMNSGIQCLAAVAPLANYYLSEKWKEELNKENPLGTGGRLSSAFAELIKDLWGGAKTSVAPSDVKRAVGQINSQFSGYAQNDSQELISTLLDALHEDQNRVKEKPYTELPDANGRPDEDVAEESWKSHLKRNDSIVTDLFHGQFKSTVRCPKCGLVSVTFDPFCALSVPLPEAAAKTLPFVIVPADQIDKPFRLIKAVKRKHTIADIIAELDEFKSDPSSSWLTTEIYTKRFHKIFMNNDAANDVRENDLIVIFEVKPNHNPLAIYLEYESELINFTSVGTPKREQFAVPFIINVPADENSKNSTFKKHELESIIRSQMKEILHKPAEERFKICQVNSYSGICGVGKMKEDSVLTIDEYKSKANLIYLSTVWEGENVLTQPTPREVETEDQANIDKGIDINQCLNLFTIEEKLREGEEWYCTNCKEHKQALKHMQMWKLPPVLLIHLKRFHYNRYFRDKVCDMVHFPTRGLDLSPYVLGPGAGKARYNLLGVSNHMGRLGGGHYTANVLHTPTGKWQNFNDSFVSEANEEQGVSASAYVLFYVRDTEDWFPLQKMDTN